MRRQKKKKEADELRARQVADKLRGVEPSWFDNFWSGDKHTPSNHDDTRAYKNNYNYDKRS